MELFELYPLIMPLWSKLGTAFDILVIAGLSLTIWEKVGDVPYNIYTINQAKEVICRNKFIVMPDKNIHAPYGIKSHTDDALDINLNLDYSNNTELPGRFKADLEVLRRLKSIFDNPFNKPSYISRTLLGLENFIDKFEELSQIWIDEEVAAGKYGFAEMSPEIVEAISQLSVADRKYVSYYTKVFKIFEDINKLYKKYDKRPYLSIHRLYNSPPNNAENIDGYNSIAMSLRTPTLQFFTPNGTLSTGFILSNFVKQEITEIYDVESYRPLDYITSDPRGNQYEPYKFNESMIDLAVEIPRWKRLRPFILANMKSTIF